MTVNNSNNKYDLYNDYSRNNGSSTRDMESLQDIFYKDKFRTQHNKKMSEYMASLQSYFKKA